MVLAASVPLIVGMALVGVRGEIDSQITALVLVVTVVGGAQTGGRLGGVVSALMAATSFDFFHTQPYLSLKITNAKDIETTVLLLVVGLAVGAMADRLQIERMFGREGAHASSALGRVLEVAAEGRADDVALAVRAELFELLSLQKCWFTTEMVTLTTIDRGGVVRGEGPGNLGGDFALPVEGVALAVTWNDQCFGYVAAIPVPGVIVMAANRRAAVAMAEVLGLALAAEPATA
ncbi:MAG: hypothetical protein QOC92_545 [Acidimicrobiaceae bacterium]|jgi:hypothetical protein